MSSDQDAFARYEGLAMPVVITAPDGRIVHLNESAERFWGTTLDEVVGQRAVDALPLSAPDGLTPATGPAMSPSQPWSPETPSPAGWPSRGGSRG